MKPLKISGYILFYGIPTLLLYLATKYLIPILYVVYDLKMIISWFIASGIFVIIPLFIFGIYFAKKDKDKNTSLKARLSFHKPDKTVIIYSVVGAVITFILTGLIVQYASLIFPGYSPSPSFMKAEPLKSGEYWILLVWLSFFFFNIVGEEIFWRGFLWSKQELKFGQYTWLINGTGWLIFHIPFGNYLLLTLIPIIFIQTYVFQKTKNIWSGIIIHGLVNGIGFLLVSFGVV